jgi:hypothetical protein
MRNLIGTVNKGVHKYKIFNIAVFDVIVTIISAKLLAVILKKYFIFILLCLLKLSIVVHRWKGVRTSVDRLLFPSY